MAKYGKALGSFRIDLELDDTAFRKGIEGVKKQTRYWAQEMKTSMRLADQYGTKEDKLAAKKEGLTNVIAAQRKELDELVKRYEGSYDKATGKAGKKTLDYAREVRKAEQNLSNYEIQLKQVSKEYKLATSRTFKFAEALEKNGSRMQSFGKQTKSIGDSLTRNITKPVLGMTTAFAGLSLGKGFKRLKDIDTAKAKLKGLKFETQEVTSIMDSALESVKGTSYGMGEAATIAASAVATGIKPGKELTRYLSLTADAAGVAGASLEEMGPIFNKIQTKHKAYTGELNQLADRGLPVYEWLAEEAGITAEEVTEMARKGEISSEMLLNAIEKNIGGAAKEMGRSSFSAVLENIWASVGRIGANFLDAGGKGGGFFSTIKPMAENLLDNMDQWEKKAADLGVAFGKFFKETVNKAIDLKNAYQGLSDGQKDFIKKLGATLVLGGPVLKFFGGFIDKTGWLTKGLGKTVKKITEFSVENGGLKSSLGMLGGKFVTFATGPLGMTTLAIGAVTAGFIYFYKKSDKFRDSVNSIGRGFKKAGKNVIDFAKETHELVKLEGPTSKLSEKANVLGTGVEKSTKKALESYVNLSDGAEEKLHELFAANKNITDGLVKQYTKAGDAALKAMNESSQKQHDRLKWLFDNNSALSEEEEAKILAKLDEDNKNKEKKAQENVDKINEILRVAKEEKRALKEEEKEEILRLQRELDEQVVSSVAKKEAEQQVILERMKRNSIAMSTEAASHEIKKANEARDKTIEAAAKKRDKTIAEAIYQRDTTGTLSRQQADKVIASAEDEYKQVTKKARDTRTETVNTITAQNSEIVTNVDTKTGEVKTKWQKMWEAVKGSTKKGAQDTSSGWDWVLKLLGAGVTKPAFPYAKGTPQGGHPGGLAIVGDGGKHELVVPKGGKPFLSPATDTLIPLPKGSEVLSGEKTEMLFKNMIPQYKNGTGGFLDKLISSSKSAFSKVKDWSVGIWDWLTSKTKVKELLANKIGPQNIVGVDLHKKLHDSGMSKSIDLASSDIFKRAETLMPMGGFVGDTSVGSNGVYNYLMNIARSLMRKYNMIFTSGFRPGDPYDHGKGLAVDIALPGVVNGSPIYQAAAEDAIRMPGIKYVITNGKWKHKGKSWVPWPDGDHYDHVHISGEKPVKQMASQALGGSWAAQIKRAAAVMGQSVTPSEIAGIQAQIQRESGGNQRIVQSSAVWDVNMASGNPAKGLLQYVPSTFNNYKVRGYEDIFNGFHQLLAFFNNSNWRRDLPYGRSGWGPSGSRIKPYANGGLVNRHQLAEIAEGNKPEMIIPLTKKTRAVELINKAKSIIGMENGSVVVNNDTERLEALVAKQADMVESMSEKMIALLEIIAQKELTIDDESFNRNVNSGQGMLLKKNLVRG